MTARERLAPLLQRLRAVWADEKQRVNLLVCTGLAGLLLLAVSVVMVTLASGSESIYATDTDSDGASTHVLLGSGGADGLVETVQTPQVQGVAVVCEGGGNATVQSRVTALVEALTGVGASHITVAKMASTK